MSSGSPRILLVSNTSAPVSLPYCYYRAAIRGGYKACLHLFWGESPDTFVSKVIFKLNSSALLFRRAIERLLRKIKSFQPDLVLVSKGNEFSATVLAELKSSSAAIVFNLYTDSPVVDPGYPKVIRHSFSAAIEQYDCIFTFARFLIPVFYQWGGRRVEYLPFAHDPETHRPTKVSQSELTHYQSLIAYLGTWGPSQEGWLELLAPFGLKIWGIHWDHLPRTSVLRDCWQRPGAARYGLGTNMAKVCHAAAIVFNVVRAEHGCGHSMKTFEIPACRGFMLSNRTDEQLEYYEEDKAAVYFSTKEELLEKIRFYSKHEALRERIAAYGYQETLKHTYYERLKQIVNVYHQLR